MLIKVMRGKESRYPVYLDIEGRRVGRISSR